MLDSENSFYDNLAAKVRARFYFSLEVLLDLAEELVHINLLLYLFWDLIFWIWWFPVHELSFKKYLVSANEFVVSVLG